MSLPLQDPSTKRAASTHSRNALVWALLSIMFILLVLGAMWLRYAQNHTSTVDPSKTSSQTTQ